MGFARAGEAGPGVRAEEDVGFLVLAHRHDQDDDHDRHEEDRDRERGEDDVVLLAVLRVRLVRRGPVNGHRAKSSASS